MSIKEFAAKGLVAAGKTALAALTQPTVKRSSTRPAHLLWRIRLQQSLTLLNLLVGEECEREAHEGDPMPGHEAKCIQCYAREVLEKQCPTVTEMIDATEQVLCRIDDFGEIDFRGLGEALTFWGNQE